MKKGNSKQNPPKTGAPPAHFLAYLGVSRSLLAAEYGRKQREFLAKQSTKEIAERINLELLELAYRVRKTFLFGWFENEDKTKRDMRPTLALAVIGTLAANLLEELATTNPLEIISTAARRNSWPVNMQLGKKNEKTVLIGAGAVKDYLTKIRLGWKPPRIYANHRSPKTSPFRQAAELLYNSLLDWREIGAWRGYADGEPTEWNRKLSSLRPPMTPCNVNEWWADAKEWMDEQWAENPDLFKPLIASCASKGKSLTDAGLFESERKSRMINLRLKEAFFALAKATEL
jgi:hypothetical protein